ncbi:MAG: hypothetical protein E6614_34500 [Bradyrhizobium sp.]|jgi:hypothetical protein|uniref:Uncharacterized protein n=1 Tax=Bradyrhizobium denitrificans TaxID=2734912 RepID=A0ABS5G370_9BRAD|nr:MULTISPECIES: hypothetical protein [Bradyrhizobium]MBR1135519.1 hypothetical protein [Bradyrhizobium denitrificans]MDU1490768.1 hypothetical protein [Bradyrhizobium sp.]MDU1540946.1 hypothetical protein [Bradyrhizobium sp.]MDU1671391.1 hypothetical protein [Bradyrhizobium sp.]MDU1688947.1 hypothetical protein [Bradyrhizobium sp.]
MRVVLVVMGLLVSGLLASPGAAQAATKFVLSGRPVILYQAGATNPDCTAAGEVVLRVIQEPEHGKVTIRRAGFYPTFPDHNVRSACNRRRVPGVQAVYVSQRGYTGMDMVVIEAFWPAGRAVRFTAPIRVM